MVASRWLHSLPFAATFISRSTSSAVRYSRGRRAALATRRGGVVPFTIGGPFLRFTRKPLDTVGEVGSSGGEAGEARGAGGGAWGRPEPGGEALDIDRGRGRHVLEVGLGEAAIAAAAQPERAHALRDGPLDPGPSRVGTPALLGRDPPPRGLERLAFGARLQLQVPGLVFAARAQGPCRAGAAVRLAEPDRDVGRAGVVDLPGPGRGELAFGAARPLLVPVDLEAVDRVP